MFWALAPWLSGCGARDIGESAPSEWALAATRGLSFTSNGNTFCEGDLDCPNVEACLPRACQAGVCVELPRLDCDDNDACTLDSCAEEGRSCSHQPRSVDLDADGYLRPLPGFAPGAPGACGDDCNDTSANAFPGGAELCDGVDNDCNGNIDDGFEYQPTDRQPQQLSTGSEGELGGLAHSGDYFAVSLSYNIDHNQNQLLALYSEGDVVFETDVAAVNSDTFAGPLLWTGNTFATAWEDRRDRDYEIYFNRFDVQGNKLATDLRVTTAAGFSLNPELLFTGSEYLVAWDDRRLGRGRNHIFAQRLSADGQLLTTDNVDLTPDADNAESPALAAGVSELVLVYNTAQWQYSSTPLQEATQQRVVAFRRFAFDLSPLDEEQLLSAAGGVGAQVHWNRDRYVVTWHEYLAAPGDAIWAATLSAEGALLQEPRRITEPAGFARTHSVLPLGDRLLLIWAEAASDGPYALYVRALSPELEPLSDAQVIPSGEGEALGPVAAFSADGHLGIAYTDFRDGSPQAYFTTLVCAD